MPHRLPFHQSNNSNPILLLQLLESNRQQRLLPQHHLAAPKSKSPSILTGSLPSTTPSSPSSSASSARPCTATTTPAARSSAPRSPQGPSAALNSSPAPIAACCPP